LEGFDSIFGRKSPHNQCHFAIGCCLDGCQINSLRELRHEVTASIQLHNKFCIFHSLSLFLRKIVKPVVHFSRIGATLHCYKRDLPHSKQLGFNRDVINPQDGHILCDPYPAMRGVSLCILCSSRIANSTISRPKEMLIALISVLLLGCRPRVKRQVTSATATE
jgi:hypothetical protein